MSGQVKLRFSWERVKNFRSLRDEQVLRTYP